MAANLKENGNPDVKLRLTVGSGIVSGDPVEIVDLHGVALTDYNAPTADAKATVRLPGITCVYEFTVEAVNNSGNVAVAIGDKLFYDTAATIKINKDVTNGKLFGYALETITSGSSDTIKVAMFQGE